MSIKKEQLLKKKKLLLSKLEKKTDFIKGNITQVTRKGVVTNSHHLTYKDKNQVTCTKSIPAKLVPKTKEGIANMKIVRDIIDEIALINIELLKETDLE